MPRPCCCSSHGNTESLLVLHVANAHAAVVAMVMVAVCDAVAMVTVAVYDAVAMSVTCVPLHTALKPVIQHYPPDMVAMEGERVTIRPVVSGSPPPTVAWYHDNCMVSSDYSHEVKDDGTLILVCAELKQSGEYRFTVSNNAGSIQGQVGGVM